MKRLYWIVCLIVLTGCGTIALSQVKIAQSSLKRLSPTNDAQADISVYTASEQEFASDLYHMLSSQPGNILFSPHSLYQNLIMDYSGARGNTQSQMAAVLHIALPDERLHAAANALDLDLSSAGSKDRALQLSIANSQWLQQDFPFLHEYLDFLAQNYGAGIHLVDYTQDASRQQAVMAINQWTSDQTHGKINDLVDPSVLNDLTRMVLVNTVYFNAEWLDRFEPFGAKNFTLRDGAQVRVPFMTSERFDNNGHSIPTSGIYHVGRLGQFRVVEIPYKGSRMSFVILLPDDNTSLAALEANLTAEYLRDLLDIQPDDFGYFIEMPKFEFEVPLEVTNNLARMGMPDAFDAKKADFSGMADFSAMPGNHNLYISNVVQKTFINVNELGTEAASASFTGFKDVAMPISLRINRPFLFLIYDRTTGAVLFMGRMEDPR